MKKFIYLSLLILSSLTTWAQPTFKQPTFKQKKSTKNKWLSGMYLQWGYNNVWYTKSNIHFRLSNGDHFMLHHAKAHQRTSFDALYQEPLQISVPQYNYRIGFYINKNRTKAIELNFDHTKYVVTDWQTVRVTGTIDGKKVDEDKILDPQNFLHFEHTDGANWLHLNYVSLDTLLYSKKLKRNLISSVWKAGAGINIPRTDFTYHGDRLNNKFHIAGFNASVEGGARVYPFKFLFVELTGKTGFVDYINALVDTKEMKGNRANQTFGYFEVIGTIGADIHF